MTANFKLCRTNTGRLLRPQLLTHTSSRESKSKKRSLGSDLILLLASDLNQRQKSFQPNCTVFFFMLNYSKSLSLLYMSEKTIDGAGASAIWQQKQTYRWVKSLRPRKAFLVMLSILLPSMNLFKMVHISVEKQKEFKLKQDLPGVCISWGHFIPVYHDCYKVFSRMLNHLCEPKMLTDIPDEGVQRKRHLWSLSKNLH